MKDNIQKVVESVRMILKEGCGDNLVSLSQWCEWRGEPRRGFRLWLSDKGVGVGDSDARCADEWDDLLYEYQASLDECRDSLKKKKEGTYADIEIDDVVEAAQFAFWAVIAAHYPEAISGDFPPMAKTEFDAACTDAVKTWLLINHPEFDVDDFAKENVQQEKVNNDVFNLIDFARYVNNHPDDYDGGNVYRVYPHKDLEGITVSSESDEYVVRLNQEYHEAKE